MSIARRTLLTATAAGTVLCALWFVPSANATAGTAATTVSAGSAQSRQEAVSLEYGDGPLLADTGTGTDTTPYVIGGTACLLTGAGLVTYSVRRSPRHVAF